MKKYLLMATVVIGGLSFVACSGQKSEKATEPVQQEQAAPAVQAADSTVVADSVAAPAAQPQTQPAGK